MIKQAIVAALSAMSLGAAGGVWAAEAVSDTPALGTTSKTEGNVDRAAANTDARLGTGAAAGNADAQMIKRGEYLSRAGDCIACHTAGGGKPFAGGLGIASPLGTIYSTNITPDKDTGIGNYTLEDFDRALREGKARDGHSLYPAMPYTAYANVTPDDINALYTYFMHGVTPVNQANKDTDIVWPLSMRWPLGIWRWMFAPDPVAANASASNTATPASATASSSTAGSPAAASGTRTAAVGAQGSAPSEHDALLRGKYLVEGLGHCSSCHTPRGFALQEKAVSEADGTAFLSGAVIDNWLAKNLRGDMVGGLGTWTKEDIAVFLKSGSRNSHAAAFGGMAQVVQDSTQYLTDADLNAIAVYLKSLPPVDEKAKTPLAANPATAQALRVGSDKSDGAMAFLNNCAACHRSTGQGYAETFPQLALSSTVNTADPTSLIHIVLKGAQMPGTASAPTEYAMPGFDWRLTDKEVADVVTFVRNSWGNSAAAVSASDVAKVRKDVGGAPPPQR